MNQILKLASRLYSQASTYSQSGTLAEVEENYAEARGNLQIALEIYVEYKEEYWRAIALIF